MQPRSEMVHWFFGAGILFVGLCLLSQAVVGREVWELRRWRKYLWPGLAFTLGVLLWPVMAFFTNSAIHMYAHGSWAEVLMLAGGAELGLVHGRLRSPLWRLTWPLAFVVTGAAFIIHEQNPWFFARSAFLHHLLGWTFLLGGRRCAELSRLVGRLSAYLNTYTGSAIVGSIEIWKVFARDAVFDRKQDEQVRAAHVAQNRVRDQIRRWISCANYLFHTA